MIENFIHPATDRADRPSLAMAQFPIHRVIGTFEAWHPTVQGKNMYRIVMAYEDMVRNGA